MVKKSDALLKFQENVTEHGAPMCLRTDNGGKNSSNAYRFCREAHLKQEHSPETPQQNGVAEYYNRVITEMTRRLLAEAKLPKMFWARALSTVVRIRNWFPMSNNEKCHSTKVMH